MTPMTVKKLIDIVHGKQLSGSDQQIVSGISIDSRTIKQDEAFVAIVGDRVDGHDFIPQLFLDGVKVALVTRNLDLGASDGTLVLVDDPVHALAALARYERETFSGPVIGLTGSNGKTTTKEMLAILFGQESECLYTKGNYNNEIGLPLTILQRTSAHGSMILEMGMRGKGQIEHLCAIAKPTAGLITNIGQSHIELLGSQEGIASAKAELLQALPDNGPAVLWGDDVWLKKVSSRANGPVYWYGLSSDHHAYATTIVTNSEGTEFMAHILGNEANVFLPAFGNHNVINAVGAMLMGALHGIGTHRMAEALRNLQPTSGRLNIKNAHDGRQVIDDTYNASPLSVKASLNVLKLVAGTRPAVAILGDMYELGAYETVGHEQVGEDAVSTGVDVILAVGPKSASIANRAIALGHRHVEHYPTKQALVQDLACHVPPNSVVLVKASRGMRLEEVVNELLKLSC